MPHLPGRYPDYIHASSHSPLLQEVQLQIQIPLLQGELPLPHLDRSSAFHLFQYVHGYVIRSSEVSGVFRQVPVPREVRHYGWSFLVQLLYRHHNRKSGSPVLQPWQHRLQPFPHLLQIQASLRYLHIYWHFSDHRSVQPNPQWNKYHDVAAGRSDLLLVWNAWSWLPMDIPSLQADVRLHQALLLVPS